DDIHLQPHEFSRDFRNLFVVGLRRAQLDDEILSFHITELLHALHECSAKSGNVYCREPTDAPDLSGLLLCARCERPRRCAAEQRDELAPVHSITSSARPSSGSGKVRPSVLAVLRLITNSTFTAS